MIPSFFIPIECLPLNRNGKIDRKALPEPDEAGLTRENQYVAPRNERERILCDIFKDILKLEQVSIHDNFFHIGGHSLLATQLAVKISQYFNINCPVRLIFDIPTVDNLFSLEINRLIQSGLSALPKIEVIEKFEYIGGED